MDLVSVIIPCYNSESLVGRAVDSVLKQTYSEIELLLINNNSTDNTLQVIEAYQKLYPNKIRVYAETKKGASAARNLGLSKANGNWIQFLDADDELLPEKLKVQMLLVANESPDLIVDDYRKVHANRKAKPIENIKSNDDPWLGLINSRLGITSANLWKKESLVKINGWDDKLVSSQEYDLLFRLLKKKPKIVVNHEINTIIHAQSESISRTADTKKKFTLIYNRYKLRKNIYNFLKENNLLNDIYKESLHFYLYYHLLLISEFDKSLFTEQCKEFNFKEISFKNKFALYRSFIGHSSKRKFGNSNTLFKAVEWYSYFVKNINLLKY